MQCQNPSFFFFILFLKCKDFAPWSERGHGSATADWIPPFRDSVKVRIRGSRPVSWKCDGRLDSAVWG